MQATLNNVWKLTGYGYLNFDFEEHLPFKSGRIYKYELKAEDDRMFIWVVSSIEDVTDTMPVIKLPKVFRAWDTGGEAAGVPPFDVAD